MCFPFQGWPASPRAFFSNWTLLSSLPLSSIYHFTPSSSFLISRLLNQKLWKSEILPYLKADRLACHSFIIHIPTENRRRMGQRKRPFITHGKKTKSNQSNILNQAPKPNSCKATQWEPDVTCVCSKVCYRRETPKWGRQTDLIFTLECKQIFTKEREEDFTPLEYLQGGKCSLYYTNQETDLPSDPKVDTISNFQGCLLCKPLA